ncbi:hypothetical protein ACP70R_008533 [Stipagrostis hirtigluma subsp. patula]
MADEGFIVLPDDASVQILLFLPTSSRRRFRLVCKRWRDLIDDRTPERHVRTKILAFSSQRGSSRAVVYDDHDGRRRHEWTYPWSHGAAFLHIVGTCNGLLCLHESRQMTLGGGAGCCSTVTVTNPITGEAMALPPVPPPRHGEQFMGHGKYSFGYHPTTGRYKVVHVPRRRRRAVDVVQVFTLGGDGDGASWRDVPVLAPDASYDTSSGAISVDGSTYWLTAFSDRVMALDLEDEVVTSFKAPPTLISTNAGWRLTNVHARLGLAVTEASPVTGLVTRVEVWVVEGGGEQRRWSRRYNIIEGWERCWITAPCFTHGQYILRKPWRMHHSYRNSRIRERLYRHKVGDLCGVDGKTRQEQPLKGEELTMNQEDMNNNLVTLAYVETLEPLPSSIR